MPTIPLQISGIIQAMLIVSENKADKRSEEVADGTARCQYGNAPIALVAFPSRTLSATVSHFRISRVNALWGSSDSNVRTTLNALLWSSSSSGSLHRSHFATCSSAGLCPEAAWPGVRG